jgi:hypothetical protein
MRCKILSIFLAACLPAVLSAAGHGQVLNAEFRRGMPQGWTLSGGAGGYDRAARSLSVTGNGEDMNYWSRAVPGLKSDAVYRVRFRARITPGSSSTTVISGLDVCNRDFSASQEWQPYTFVFTTPADVSRAFARLGQWHLKGTLQFSEFYLAPVLPVYRHAGALTLGAGERMDGQTYEFNAPLGGEGSNSARTLASHTAAFNSNRWVFTGGSEVVYKFEIPGAQQTGAEAAINVNYYTGGECVVSVSRDGTTWVEAQRLKSAGGGTVQLPVGLFPASAVFVRLQGTSSTNAAGNSEPGAFQVDGFLYRAKLDRSLPPADGATRFLEVRRQDPGIAVRVDDLGSFGMRPPDALRLTLMPAPGLRGYASVEFMVWPVDRPLPKGRRGLFYANVPLKGQKAVSVTIPYRYEITGRVSAMLSVIANERRREKVVQRAFEARTEDYVPPYYAADYGYRLVPPPVGDLWWCESTYKINPFRPAPGRDAGTRGRGENPKSKIQNPKSQSPNAVTLSAAGRERVAFQLVLRPRKESGPIRVTVGDLIGPGGARIPKTAAQIREVAYVRVRVPTDRVGIAGEWPDPLPPLEGAWKLQPGRNNPLWFTVTVPANARPGDYQGRILLQAGRDWVGEIPLRLRVRGFSLPAKTALRSGFGINPGYIRQHHNLQSDESMQRVWDLYMQDFKAHRLCTYNPMALAPYKVEVTGVYWTGGFRDKTRSATGEYSLRVEDNRTDQAVTASYTQLIPVTPGRRYHFSWACMTEKPGQPYEVTLGCYDAARAWIPYHNIDIRRTGSGEWQKESVDVSDRIPKEARFIVIALRPCPWTEKGENTGTAWFDDIGFREEPGLENMVADASFEYDVKPEVKMDFIEFDRAARRYLDEFGFNSFAIGIQGLGGGRYPNYDHGSFFGYAAGTPEYDDLMGQYGRQLQDHLEQNGWLSKAYVYWYDEPEANDYPFVRQGMERLRQYFPKLKRMLTEEFEGPLYGSVDLWCPITPNFAPQPSAARQKLGEEVWWYVCTGPKEPYCALFIDHPAIEMRMWLWQTWKYRVQGILIWETTWWTSPQQFRDKPQDPWADPMSYVADTAGVWGNGDGRFFYPPRRREGDGREYVTAPIDSMRWELLAEGVQDWEYFHMLDGLVKQAEARGDRSAAVRLAKRLLVVPDAICRDMTHYTTDPQPLYRRREALAQAIETLLVRRK